LKEKGGDLLLETESLIHEDRPQQDVWLRLILFGVLGLTLVLGIVFLEIDRAGAKAMFGVTAFDALLFNFILPRSYQIYSNRLVIVLGRPFKMTIPYANITTVRKVSGSNALGSGGIRFATSTKFVVEVTRRKGLSVIISPSDGEIFLEQLGQAMKTR
jgi:hypothetical protein